MVVWWSLAESDMVEVAIYEVVVIADVTSGLDNGAYGNQVLLLAQRKQPKWNLYVKVLTCIGCNNNVNVVCTRTYLSMVHPKTYCMISYVWIHNIWIIYLVTNTSQKGSFCFIAQMKFHLHFPGNVDQLYLHGELHGGHGSPKISRFSLCSTLLDETKLMHKKGSETSGICIVLSLAKICLGL